MMRSLIARLLVWLGLKKPSKAPPPTIQGGGGPGEEK